MRTTIDIEDDVLAAAKEIARREHLTAGQIISRLARLALTGAAGAARAGELQPATVAGFRPLPAGGSLVSNDQVNTLREAEGV